MMILMDNGSLEPESTLSLRRIAAALSARLGEEVAPVSLLHSHKIAPERIDGIAADTLERYLKAGLATGETTFTVLPLFIGPSAALTEYLPGRLEKLRAAHPALDLRVADPLWREDDPRLLSLLLDHARAELARMPAATVVVLVDHGSPQPAVTRVRDQLASGLAEALGDAVSRVVAASMERRPEPEYDFNEPLLATALDAIAQSGGTGEVLLLPLFLQPGRHAGPGGDIDQICDEARSRHPGLGIRRAPLLGVHPGLLDILADRARAISR